MRPKLPSRYSLFKHSENTGLMKNKNVLSFLRLQTLVTPFMRQSIFSLNSVSLSSMLENYGRIIPTSRGKNRDIRGESGLFLYVQ